MEENVGGCFFLITV